MSLTQNALDEAPFGITLDDIAAFDRKQEANRVYNAPIRDVNSRDFWDFMLEPALTDDDTAYPADVLEELSGGDLN
jgi:hypothetical protein